MEKASHLYKRPYFKIVLIVIFIFALKSNSAWVQHRVIDGEFFVFNYPKSVPFMWQYDRDARIELSSAAFFPELYRTHPTLISRPTYQLSAYLIGNSLGFFINPLLNSDFLHNKISIMASRFELKENIATETFAQLETQYKDDAQRSISIIKKLIYASIGFIIFKIFMYILAGILMYHIIRDYSDESVALLSVALLLFTGYSINGIATYHTYELEFITPIIIIFLFINLCKSYSIRKNILFSFIVGILMLGKANYAVYLAVLSFSFFIAGLNGFVIRGVVISVMAHLLPWLAWNVFLEMQGMSIIGIINDPHPNTLALHPADIIGRKILNRELVSSTKVGGGQSQPGVAFIEQLFSNNPIHFFQIILAHTKKSLTVMFGSIWGLLSVAAIPLYKHRYKKEILLFLFIFLITTWIQAFIAFPYGPKGRTLIDPSFIIFGFASFTIYFLISSFANKYKKGIIFLILFAHISINIFAFVKLPWVHPFKQQGKYLPRQ
jgi:hypothetical protein